MSGPLPNVAPIRREPLAAEVARRLVDYLLSGGVEPGGRMPSERQLAEAFGVGRSAVREAIAALTLIGLIEARHGDGTYLKRPDSSLLPQVVEWGLLLGEQRTIDLVEARQKIEVDIAGLAAQRRTEEDLGDLAHILARMEQESRDGARTAAFVDADVDRTRDRRGLSRHLLRRARAHLRGGARARCAQGGGRHGCPHALGRWAAASDARPRFERCGRDQPERGRAKCFLILETKSIWATSEQDL